MSTISASTTSTTAYKVTADTTGTLVLQTGASPTTAVTIDSSQNVGIGTSSPQGNLALKAASGNTNFAIESAASSRYFISVNNTSNYLAIGGNGATAPSSGALNIDSSGKVGINQTGPATWLDVKGGSTTQRAYIAAAIRTSRGASNQYGGICLAGNVVADAFIGMVPSSDDLVFGHDAGTSLTEEMRLMNGGNLLLGATAQISNERFYVLTNGDTDGICVRNSAASSGKYWKWYNGTNNSIYFRNQNNVGVYITDGGTSWSGYSDERLKTQITPFDNAVQKICSLRAGTGRYLTDEETVSRSFLIAQDVQAVLPEAVDVQPDEQGTLGLRYTDLIPLLTAAIQELKAELDAAKADIATLKGAA